MNEEIARAFVRILADTTRFGPEARAKIEAALRGIHPEVDVDADTGAAEAKLAALDVVINQIDGSDPEVDVHVDDHGTIAATTGRLTMLLALAAAVSPALVPIGAALTGALAGGAAAAGAGIAGLGTVALGVSGVAGAVKALGAEHNRAGEAAERSAITQVNAASRIESAEASLANTRANAAYQAEQAQRRIADAVESERLAEVDLRRAREEARQELEDLQRQAEQGALAEKDAVLAVREAQFKLNETLSDRRKGELEKDRARLDYEEAKQRLDDLRADNQRLADEKAEADKKGVAGSDAVTEAQRRLADAQENVTEARHAAAEQERQAAFSVSQAQRAVADAHQSAATSASSHAEAEDKVAEAMANLSPEARRFAHFIHDDLLPEFYDLRKTAQAGLLPGVQDSIKRVLPLLPDLSDFVGDVSHEMGSLADEAADALDTPFWQRFFDYVDRNAVPTLDEMGDVTGNLAHGFAGLLEAFEPVERQMGAGLVNLTNRFADFGEAAGEDSEFQEFITYVQTTGPQVVHTIGDIAGATGALAESLSVVGGPLLTIIDLIAKLVEEEPDLAAFVLQLWAWDKVIGSIGGKASRAAKSVGLFAAAEGEAQATSKGTTAGGLNPLNLALAAITVTALEVWGGVKQMNAEIEHTKVSAQAGARSYHDYLSTLEAEADKMNKREHSWNPLTRLSAELGPHSAAHEDLDNFKSNIDALTRSFAVNRDTAVELAQAAGADLTGGYEDAAGAIDDWVRSNVTADAQGRKWANTTLLISSLTNGAEDATTAFDRALALLTSTERNATDTRINYKQAMDDLTKAVKNGSTSLNENTDKGRNNIRMIETAQRAAEDHAKAVYDQTLKEEGREAATKKATKVLETDIDRLKTHAEKLGFDKDKVDKLIGSYDSLPETVTTETKSPGLKEATDWSRQLRRNLQALTNREWEISIGARDPSGAGTTVFVNPPGRAGGGPVDAYTDYLVGEHGAEVVRFNQPGHVYPTDSPVTAAALGRSVGLDDARIVAALQELIRVVQQQTGVLVAQPSAMADGLNGASRGARHRYRTTVR